MEPSTDTTTTAAAVWFAATPISHTWRNGARVIAACLIAFILPVFLFPTLHAVHDFYNLENGVFFLLAVAALLSYLPEKAKVITTIGLLTLQMLTFQNLYYPDLAADTGVRAATNTVTAHTRPDDVLLIYGMEWNPELPYYAQRRAIMEPASLVAVGDAVRRGNVALHPKAGVHIGAIIRCPCPWDGVPEYEAMFQRWGLPRSNACVIKYRP